jgi:predicted Rossmann fold nucleotide-binding protein DprA/Smf involved in DNA uptake
LGRGLIRGASGIGAGAFAGADEVSATSALASAGEEIAVTATLARDAPESCAARERG